MDLEYKIAECIAREAHRNQFRRDRVTPYFDGHVRLVALQFDALYEGKQKAVAYLHDVLEDCPNYTPARLLSFGISQEVVDAVVAITKIKGESYDDYLVRVKGNFLAKEVKLVDIACNLADKPTERQKAKYEKALFFLLSC